MHIDVQLSTERETSGPRETSSQVRLLELDGVVLLRPKVPTQRYDVNGLS